MQLALRQSSAKRIENVANFLIGGIFTAHPDKRPDVVSRHKYAVRRN